MEKQMENEMETRGLLGCIGLQIAQCRYYLQTLGPNVGIIYRHGAPGISSYLWIFRFYRASRVLGLKFSFGLVDLEHTIQGVGGGAMAS